MSNELRSYRGRDNPNYKVRRSTNTTKAVRIGTAASDAKERGKSMSPRRMRRVIARLYAMGILRVYVLSIRGQWVRLWDEDLGREVEMGMGAARMAARAEEMRIWWGA